jgi:hypothetical protein
VHAPPGGGIRVLEGGHEPGDVGRVALQVAVHGDHDRSARPVVAGVQCRRQAPPKLEANIPDPGIPPGELAEPLGASVRARVVDEDDFEALPVHLEDADQLRPEEGEVLHLVEDGQDHRELEQVTRDRRHGTIHRQEPRST